MKSNETRLLELDSLRGLAALGVVCWHYTNMWQAAPLKGIFAPFYAHGLLLVDFFFVLSGFVLARAYWNDQRRESFGKNVIERVARMYPLHLVALLAVVPIQIILQQKLGPLDYLFKNNDPYHFVLNLLLLNRSSLERGFSFNAPAWSISTEMIINLLFFCAITLSRKVASAIMIIAFAIAISVIAKHGLITDRGAFGLNPDIFRTLAGFFIGVGLYKAIEKRLDEPRRHAVQCDVICLVSVCAVLTYMVHWADAPVGDAPVSFILFPTIIVTAVRGGLMRNALKARLLVYLGEVSYSVYLTHFVLLLATLLAATWLEIKFPYGAPAFVLGFLFLTIGVSALTHRYIELPAKRAIKRAFSSYNVARNA